jgi:voltage-gated potassium channel
MKPRDRRTARRHMLRAAVACGLLLAVYYLAPVEPDVAPARAVARAAAAAAGVLLVAALVARLVVRLLRNEPGSWAGSLVVALFGGVVVFAFVDYLLATTDPGQFSGLETKTDGLYFAVTTLATVGYGDVHATGQLARGVVTAQQLYNLAVIATGVSVLVNHLKTARTPPTPPAPLPPPDPDQPPPRR